MKWKLRSLRREKGYTMEDMAQHLGYAHHSGYSKIEYGHKQISLNDAFLIAQKLECSLEEIFFEDELPVSGRKGVVSK